MELDDLLLAVIDPAGDNGKQQVSWLQVSAGCGPLMENEQHPEPADGCQAAEIGIREQSQPAVVPTMGVG